MSLQLFDVSVIHTSAGWIARASALVGGRQIALVSQFESSRTLAIQSLHVLLEDAPRRLMNSDLFTPPPREEPGGAANSPCSDPDPAQN